jgi:hypothetical protein
MYLHITPSLEPHINKQHPSLKTVKLLKYHMIPLSSTLYTLQPTLYSNQTNQAAGLAVTALPAFPVLTTLATPLVGVEAILAVILEILSITFSLATIEPFTAPAITPAMIRMTKIDRQMVHFVVSSVHTIPVVVLQYLLSLFLSPFVSFFVSRTGRGTVRVEE